MAARSFTLRFPPSRYPCRPEGGDETGETRSFELDQTQAGAKVLWKGIGLTVRPTQDAA